MNYPEISRFATVLARSFAEDLLRLLVKYADISASEAASRLNLHVKTAQDFLEELASLEIAEKFEVFEKKRPYFRYRLKQQKISLEFDLAGLFDESKIVPGLKKRIREQKNSGATFNIVGSNEYISSVSFFIGEGRQRKVRTINLTLRQGRFLYFLPFPTADFLSVSEILNKAEVDAKYFAEILDLVDLLIENGLIEIDRIGLVCCIDA